MAKTKKKNIRCSLTVHARGFGFASPIQEDHDDIFIPPPYLNGAIEGDIVSIAISSKSAKGFEGEVVEILKRKRKHLVGIVTTVLKNGDAMMFVPLIGEDRDVTLQKMKDRDWKVGDWVAMNILKSESSKMLCDSYQHMGHIDDPSVDTVVAIEDYQIRETFPPAVLKEAESCLKKWPKKGERTDLTHLECCTIDPTDARDYDDALSIEQDKKGHYHLGVHIADVSYYITPDSALDKEAVKRSNSTYFPDRVVPMLPEVLSNDLCSLKENVPRLALSVLMEFDKTGDLVKYEVMRSIILSRKRFTYEAAKEVLDGKAESPLLPRLKLLVELCGHLKKHRTNRGSVDLSMPEMRFCLTDKGMPYDVRWIEYDITHQMVEEFMLKANELVAQHLIQQGKAAIFRVHEEPEPTNLLKFFDFARRLGFIVPPSPTVEDLQRLFIESKGTPYEELIAVRWVRSMKLAIYSSENIGHYGLSLEKYLHFTSPIRRYADLICHRLLFEENYKPELKKIAKACSENERTSFKAEMGVLKLKKLRYLNTIHQKDPDHLFEASITGVKQNGVLFELELIGFDGLLHISTLGKDYFIYNEQRDCIVGEKTGVIFQPGKKINLRLQSLDLIHGQCHWQLITEKKEGKEEEGEKAKEKRPEKRGRGRKRKK